MTFSPRTRRLRRVALAALAATSLTLTSCGGSGGSDGSDGDAAPATPVTMNLPDLVLTAEDAPAGFEHLNVGDMLAAQEDAGQGEGEDAFSVMESINAGFSTDPEQCLVLQPTNVSIMTELHNRPDNIAVAEFTADHGDRTGGGDAPDSADVVVIDALVSTGDGPERLPADLAACGTFAGSITDTFAGTGDVTTFTLHSDVSDAQVDNAEDARIITVTADEDAPPTWQPITIVDGHVGEVYFRVSGHGSVDPQMLVGVAQTQVDRITGE